MLFVCLLMRGEGQTSDFWEKGLLGENEWLEEKEQILEELRLKRGSWELMSWCARSFDSMEPQSSAQSLSTSSFAVAKSLKGDHSEKYSGSAMLVRCLFAPAAQQPSLSVLCEEKKKKKRKRSLSLEKNTNTKRKKKKNRKRTTRVKEEQERRGAQALGSSCSSQYCLVTSWRWSNMRWMLGTMR